MVNTLILYSLWHTYRIKTVRRHTKIYTVIHERVKKNALSPAVNCLLLYVLLSLLLVKLSVYREINSQ